jgi:hypothetical protein
MPGSRSIGKDDRTRRAAIPHMPPGSAINTSSVNAYEPSPRLCKDEGGHRRLHQRPCQTNGLAWRNVNAVAPESILDAAAGPAVKPPRMSRNLASRPLWASPGNQLKCTNLRSPRGCGRDLHNRAGPRCIGRLSHTGHAVQPRAYIALISPYVSRIRR